MTSPLQLLHCLTPAQTLIHIGAGTGQGLLHQWHDWGISRVLLVDADPERMSWAESLTAANSGWQLTNAVLADIDDTVVFHQASNPAEDGLIPAQPLRALWPNLMATGQQQRLAQRLDTLLAQARAPSTEEDANTWLLVDCLPALPILQGAIGTLGHCNVVCVRTLLQPLTGIASGAALKEIDTFLQGHGFRCIDIQESLQPAVGYVLFVRDWPGALRAQTDRSAMARDAETAAKAEVVAQRDAEAQAKREAIAQRDALTAERDQLLAARDAETAAKAEALAQRDAEAQAKTEAIAQRDALTAERDQLLAAHDAETAAKAEALAQRDAEAQAKRDAIAQRDALTAERNQLAAARDAETATKAEALAQRDAEAQAKTEAIAQRDALTAERDQLLAAHDAETAAKAEALAQRDAEAQVKRDAIAQRDALTAERNQLAAARDAETAAKAEALAQRDAEAQAKTEAIAQRDALTAERDQIAAARDAEAAAKAEVMAQRDDAAQLANGRQLALAKRQEEHTTLQQRIQQLEAANNEHAYRQQLQQEEMIKAEAQIELIKDLLLREPGL